MQIQLPRPRKELSSQHCLTYNIGNFMYFAAEWTALVLIDQAPCVLISHCFQARKASDMTSQPQLPPLSLPESLSQECDLNCGAISSQYTGFSRFVYFLCQSMANYLQQAGILMYLDS